MAELRERLVVDDAFINKMLGNPRWLIEFPFLKQHAAAAKAQARGASCCGNRKAATKTLDYTNIKRTLAAMPDPKKARLLELAEAKSVALVYRNLRNEVVKLVITRAKQPA